MSDNPVSGERDRFQRRFLLILVVFISILFFTMIRQFLLTILLAGIFAGMMSPLYRRLVHLFRGNRPASSAVTLLAVTLVIIVPLLLLLTIVVAQAVRISSEAGPWIQTQIRQPDLIEQKLRALPGFEYFDQYRPQILTKVGEMAAGIGGFVVGGLSAATRGTVAFLFQFFLFLYSLFFFLMDGSRFLQRILYYAPLAPDQEQILVDRFVSITRATIKGTLIIGLIQGTLAALALAAAGISHTIFWGAIMTVLSIVPGIGTGLVWVPAVIYLAATGHVPAAIAVAAWCLLAVGSVDNLLRPRLVGKDTRMHDLMILISTIGGLLFFGVAGFIIGPIIAGLFVSVWSVYGTVFRELLPATSPDADDGSR